ncbi:MAG: TIGR04086 family membrane protein [Clostridia bacterium]|nr:TIGR04086 family membrane protein [Clostridia bacterium]
MNARHKVRKRKTEGSDNGLSGVLRHSLVGFFCGVATLTVFLLVGAAVASNTEDPDSLINIFAFSALYISALICGAITTKRCNQNILLSGALGGVWLVLSLSLISVFFKTTSSAEHAWGIEMLIRCSVVLVSALGGYIGANRPKNTNKKRRRG